MPTGLSKAVSDTIALAQDIVKVQGAIFIKNLLRQKRTSDSTIRIGTSKEQVLENLVEAIKEGKIVQSELDEWVRSVEGWGRQHVYLYRVPLKLTKEPIWTSQTVLKSRLKEAKRSHLLDAPTGVDFPEQLTLASIRGGEECFEAIWQERLEQWHYDQSQDPEPKVIDGDLYKFRAYRQQLNRSVMRFAIRPSGHIAGLFVQIPLSDPKHKVACETARDTLSRLFAWEDLKLVQISKAIKALDQAELDSQDSPHGQIVSQHTRFAAGGASVEFEADPAIRDWKRITAVRQVRRALDSNAFIGDAAKFRVMLRSGTGLNRDVIVSLNGRTKRIYLHAQMTAEEVWPVLLQVLEHGK